MDASPFSSPINSPTHSSSEEFGFSTDLSASETEILAFDFSTQQSFFHATEDRDELDDSSAREDTEVTSQESASVFASKKRERLDNTGEDENCDTLELSSPTLKMTQSNKKKKVSAVTTTSSDGTQMHKKGTPTTATSPKPATIVFKYDDDLGKFVPVVKRGRGRPRKNSLPPEISALQPSFPRLPSDYEIAVQVAQVVNMKAEDFTSEQMRNVLEQHFGVDLVCRRCYITEVFALLC